MFEHVVNSIYVGVLFVYYWPFVVTMTWPIYMEMGLVEKVPDWVYDTSWRGFLLSPYRLLKGMFNGKR